MKILIRGSSDNQWHLVESAAYLNETHLQNLLAESPGVVSIDEVRPQAGPLVVAVREFGVQGRAIDLLAFTARGDIAIIECKLAANPEVKRKVIGQALEYGALLWEMQYEDIDAAIRARTQESLADLVRQAVNETDWDEEFFRSNVTEAVATGNFMLIIVVDEITEDLARVVQFMNVCGSPSFEFAALEMRRFSAENTEILAPRVLGPVRAAKTKDASGPIRKWDEASFFEELHRRKGETTVTAARCILDWAARHTNPFLDISWGEGKRSGSYVISVIHKEKQYQLFAVWTSGVLENYFYWLSYKPPFDAEAKRLELLGRLNKIDGVALPVESINRRPSIRLSSLSPNCIEQIIGAYEWVIEEIIHT